MNALVALRLSLFVIATILMCLALSMAIRRAYRDVVLAQRERYESSLRPQLLALVSDDDPDLSAIERLSPAELQVIESLVWKLLSKVRGSSRDILVSWLERKGAVERARIRTHRAGRVGRARAAEKLGAAGIRSTSPDVVRLLDDRDQEVRIVAARALAKLGDPSAVPALLEALEGDRQVPTSIVSMALLHIGPSVVEELDAGLASSSRAIRSVCVDLVGMNGSISSVRWLNVILEHDDTLDVRIRAATALGRIGVPQGVESLCRALRADNPRALRVAAAGALGQIGGRDAIAALHLVVAGDDQQVGMAAAEALARLGEEGRNVLHLVAQQRNVISLRAAHWLERDALIGGGHRRTPAVTKRP